MNKLRRRYNELFCDIMVYFLYLIAIITAFFWLGSHHKRLAGTLGLNDGVMLNLDSIASVLSIVAAALAVVISNRQIARKEQQSTRDQIYQQLEIESINLFRFEIEHTHLARITWGDTMEYEELEKDGNLKYQVLQHVCQVLNLFEMSVRFKHHDIIHDDVFKSWIAWIYDLCSSKTFLHFWYCDGVRDNYIELFQNIIDKGLYFAHGEQSVKETRASAQRITATDDEGNQHRTEFADYMKKLHLHSHVRPEEQ